MSGNEFAREKERVAAIMQEKQKKGNDSITADFDSYFFLLSIRRAAAETPARRSLREELFGFAIRILTYHFL
jgi:hypothetical protein